jgi:hypothetical protein
MWMTHLHLCSDLLDSCDLFPLTLPLYFDRCFIIVETLYSLVQLFDLRFILDDFFLIVRYTSRKGDTSRGTGTYLVVF